MYRITKVLNHNAVICVEADSNRQYLILGKGAGFGKKVSERIEARPSDTLYSLSETTDRGSAVQLAASIDPLYLEIAGEVLDEAERVFHALDRKVLFPLADHIEYAVKRILNHEQISNPLTDDIRLLFHMEYKAAESVREILRKRVHVEIGDDEIGYIALHIHSAINDEKVSKAMQMAQAVRICVSAVEKACGKKIDILSLSYNRLMNHVRYMVARAMNGEQLKLNMNDYISVKFPESFQMAKENCREIEKMLKCKLDDVEIGYLAMHIERVKCDELGSENA